MNELALIGMSRALYYEKYRAACNAQNAENAKQENLACTDAAQLTERKEQE